MRPRIAGTVPRGSVLADEDLARHLLDGRDAEGEPAATLPAGLQLDEQFLSRGRERYGIYCAPCHDLSGGGQGPAVLRGMLRPPNLHDARLRAENVGYFYDVIKNGIRNMPAYGGAIPVEDRWAIATYVRALQLSRGASVEDVPPAIRAREGWGP
jgi:mono/diheme cytochrome c family protein